MPRKPTSKELVPAVRSGGRLRMQAASRRNWTREKEKRFLEVLAETCNVTRACEAVNIGTPSAYSRRKRNAAFRSAWNEAIGAAYQRLELVLIERTLNGTEKIMTRHDGSEDRMREYPINLGMALLKLHRSSAETVQRPVAIDNGDGAHERLVKKLLRLKKRRQK